MNFKEIVNSELTYDEEYTLEEGLFSVSPAIALFAFKDDLLNKTGTLAKKALNPVGAVTAEVEKIKAKTIGRSGKKDSDTVYKLTKEQTKVMAYIYKKYGSEMVNKISKFRTEIMPPYQLLKRNIAKNHSLNMKEIHGMTKEEYYKYRESGRKKIEKKGTYFKDAKDLNAKEEEARAALSKAYEILKKYKEGKIIDLTSTNIEKTFDSIGIGRSKLNGWSDEELNKTANEINKIEALLKDPSRQEGDLVRVSNKAGSYKAQKLSRENLEYTLKMLKEHGYNYAYNKAKDKDSVKHGSFKDAFAIHMMRSQELKRMRENCTAAEYKKFYIKTLEDAIKAAEKIYNEKHNDYTSLKGTVELNQMEKKIWGVKMLGTKYSGDINDWYLKIKPEDFGETKYYSKSDKIIEAEKEIDKLLKRFERELEKTMSSEDVALCKKYRLFNNFLTIKQFKNPENMFKDGSELKKLKSETVNYNDSKDFEELLDSAISKDYNDIKELEEMQSKLKSIAPSKMSSNVKIKYNSFIKRINPKNGDSTVSKTDRNKINSILDKIGATSYTGKTQASEDLKELEDIETSFREVNGSEELKKYSYDIERAKEKLNRFIRGE